MEWNVKVRVRDEGGVDEGVVGGSAPAVYHDSAGFRL